MSDVADSCHRHRDHKLVSKARQLRLQQTDDVAVGWDGTGRRSFTHEALLIIDIVDDGAVQV